MTEDAIFLIYKTGLSCRHKTKYLQYPLTTVVNE